VGEQDGGCCVAIGGVGEGSSASLTGDRLRSTTPWHLLAEVHGDDLDRIQPQRPALLGGTLRDICGPLLQAVIDHDGSGTRSFGGHRTCERQ